MTRTKPELISENALLRQQLIVLQRHVKRPKLTTGDRWLVVLLASRLRQWQQALLIIQPDTVLRWHRDLFTGFWRRKSRATSSRKQILDSTVALIKQMLRENRLWGAERVRGELLKLGLRVSKRTIQRYKRQVRPMPTGRQTWRTFVHNHGQDIWACDFLQVTDLLFRSLFCFFVVEVGSRKVVHVGVTRHPTEQWVAQQLRDATPFGTGPKYLIRDNDSKYGTVFDRAAAGAGIAVLRAPYHAPRANAIVERFLGSVRRECLDHLLLFGEQHLARVIKAYVRYFNDARPHQGIGQQVPAAAMAPLAPPPPDGKVISIPVLGGLHHAYHWAA
ncbi:MAG TPA: integrase core domain-containing protein [Aggregatilineaceae bacterium]|nr:integrase core domain-containing protein [Aggregatilineaceae bacterium]